MLRIKGASNARDNAILNAYGDKFIIPLDFEMLDGGIPYYQSGLGNRLCYERSMITTELSYPWE